VTLSVVLIACNEEGTLGQTLESVIPLLQDGKGEIIVVDSGSTDRTLDIARSYRAKVFIEPWKGYAPQKNSAIDKATGDWILSLDADEAIDDNLLTALRHIIGGDSKPQNDGFRIRRKNHFLGRWIKHGGFWPDAKTRLFRRGHGRFEERAVHETLRVDGAVLTITQGTLVHCSYPTLSDYIEHMNRYSSLGAETAAGHSFSLLNIILRPLLTFIYNYFFRLGFLDGREGLLLHLYHAVYVSWKYSKAWEIARKA
jgi:glycosyltransferase involved in cell wall biosynthesis